MENIQIREALFPYPGQELFDVWLYVMLFIELVLLFMIFSGNTFNLGLLAAVIIATVLDKLFIFGWIDPGIVNPATTCTTMPCAVSFHTEVSFWTFVLRIIMFAFPTVIVTMTSISKARPVAALLAGLALLYTAARLFTQQSQILNF